MVIQIINNGASLKIVTDGSPRFILKNQIREVEIIRDTIIKIDIGQGALYNVFVDQLEVTVPVSISVEDLRDKIMDMLQMGIPGFATEQKQTEGNAEIVNLKNSINEMKDKVNSLNDKWFYEPKIVDQNNINAVYKEYTITPGAATNQAVWAILKVTQTLGVEKYLWAAGNKNFDKVWDNRTVLVYS